MKIIQLLILFILVSCNGSESSSKAGNPNDTGVSEEQFSYYVQIEGDVGDSVTSMLIMNFGADDEVRSPIVMSLTNVADGAPFFGRNLWWNVKNDGVTPITVKVFKENVEIISQELAVNEIVIFRDGL